jgi:predicted phosphoribosyltransferase
MRNLSKLIFGGFMRFKNRDHAGFLLAEKLLPYAHLDPIILALPRGGVPIAYAIAKQLKAPLDIVLV